MVSAHKLKNDAPSSSRILSKEIASVDEAPGRTRLELFEHRSYVLLVLCLVYALSSLDGYTFPILLHPIKKEFNLSDTQLGFLAGMASAAFYVAFTIPLGRLADRWRRSKMIAISVSLFSVMTGALSFTTALWQLIAVRAGCAIGVAGTFPASTSMIADLYSERSRGTATALLTMGGFAGSFLAFALGGIMVENLGWRTTLQLLALPGVLLGLLIHLTVQEPKRGAMDVQRASSTAKTIPVGEVLTFLWGQRSLRHLTAGATLVYMYVYGLVTWIPSYFQRSYGMGLAETGFVLGVPIGGATLVSMFTAGVLSDRLARRDVRWRAWMVSIALGIAFPFSLLTFLAPNKTMAISTYAVSAVLCSLYQSPTYTLAQGVVPPRLRATAIALFNAFLVVVSSVGPQLMGISSDLLHARWGMDSLRYSVLAFTPLLIWASVHFYWSTRYLPGDRIRAQEES